MRSCCANAPSASREPIYDTPNLNQAIIDQFLRRDLLDSHVQSIIPGYREKLELMLEELSSFPEGTRYTAPEGGLFIFVEMPEALTPRPCLARPSNAGWPMCPARISTPTAGITTRCA